MKKKVIVMFVLAVIFAIVVTFAVTVRAASSGLLDGVLSDVKADVNAVTDNKISNMNTDLQGVVEEVLGEVKDYQANRAATEISNYYNTVMNNVESSPMFNDAANQVTQYTTTLIAQEKARIDTALAAALGN